MALQREVSTAAGPSYASSPWLSPIYKNNTFLHPTPTPTLPPLPSVLITWPPCALLGVQQGQNPEISFLFKPLGLLFPTSPLETLGGVYLIDNR